VRFVCKVLVEALNEASRAIYVLSDHPPMGDDDCRLLRGEERLSVQVTRAHRAEAVWKDVALAGTATIASDIDSLVDELIEVIREKARRASVAQRATQMLALDASDATWFILSATIDRFRVKYGEELKRLSYASIWIVGPSPSRTFRLA
jgi:hypothetical protein